MHGAVWSLSSVPVLFERPANRRAGFKEPEGGAPLRSSSPSL